MIAFDASGGIAKTDSSTSITFGHTCSGENRILIVFSGAGSTFSGVTYNGTAMTQLAGSSQTWYLINPDTGSHNVVCTVPGGQTASVVSASYTGVDQSSPIDSSHSDNFNRSSPWTINTTVVANNCWLISAANAVPDSGEHITSLSSNRTDRQTEGVGVTIQNGAGIISDSNGTVSTGSQGTTFSATTSHRGISFNASMSLSLLPAASTVNGNFLAIL